MERNALPQRDPAALLPGARIGPWRVVAWRGRGSYGVVYRAVREGREEAGPVALKLALQPEEPRFEREVQLLSRLRHPGIPRLLGRGDWRNPAGGTHPYFAMQWVQGIPLYDWASVRNPTSRQALRILAQLARGLQAVHAAQAAHRDVKGGNVLVRPADGRVFLMDFGSGHYVGASPLTQQVLPPGTPNYRSPRAWQFVLRSRNDPSARYTATPADDLFALGVTAYRLVTDEYPPSTDPREDKAGVWSLEGEGPRPPVALNPRVDARLNAFIMKLLSVRPEQRGIAGELASEMEQAAERAGRQADQPLFAVEEQAPSSWRSGELPLAEIFRQSLRRRDVQSLRLSAQYDEAEKAEHERLEKEELARSKARTERDPSRAPPRAWRPLGMVIAAGVLMVMIAPRGGGPRHSAEAPMVMHGEARAAGTKDGGTAGLGDEEELPAVEISRPTARSSGIRLDMPSKPFKGQHRPPCEKGEVEIRGGCWFELKANATECKEYAYEWKGGCFVPITASDRPATSDSPQAKERIPSKQ
jgi:serine/threonine protein kinase